MVVRADHDLTERQDLRPPSDPEIVGYFQVQILSAPISGAILNAPAQHVNNNGGHGVSDQGDIEEQVHEVRQGQHPRFLEQEVRGWGCVTEGGIASICAPPMLKSP